MSDIQSYTISTDDLGDTTGLDLAATAANFNTVMAAVLRERGLDEQYSVQMAPDFSGPQARFLPSWNTEINDAVIAAFERFYADPSLLALSGGKPEPTQTLSGLLRRAATLNMPYEEMDYHEQLAATLGVIQTDMPAALEHAIGYSIYERTVPLMPEQHANAEEYFLPDDVLAAGETSIAAFLGATWALTLIPRQRVIAYLEAQGL